VVTFILSCPFCSRLGTTGRGPSCRPALNTRFPWVAESFISNPAFPAYTRSGLSAGRFGNEGSLWSSREGDSQNLTKETPPAFGRRRQKATRCKQRIEGTCAVAHIYLLQAEGGSHCLQPSQLGHDSRTRSAVNLCSMSSVTLVRKQTASQLTSRKHDIGTVLDNSAKSSPLSHKVQEPSARRYS
jgi:hypothetical protein